MSNPLLNHMGINDLPNYLLSVLFRNLNRIPTLKQGLLALTRPEFISVNIYSYA